jgi:obg-like ATPase 1
VSAVLDITDIAGLIRGASEGAGLGNAFLSHIAAVDGIFHVCRAFPNKDVVHVDGDVDPVRDLDTIHDELRAKDITAVKNFLEKNARPYRGGVKEIKFEYEFIMRVQEFLGEAKDIRYGSWNTHEVELLNKHQFLTAKPVIYLVNVSEKAYIAKGNKWLVKLGEWLKNKKSAEKMIPFSCEFEQKLAGMGGWHSEEALAYQKEVSLNHAKRPAHTCWPMILRDCYGT